MSETNTPDSSGKSNAQPAATAKAGGTAATAAATKMLSLMKGQHRFCFRYQTGDEPQVLDALVEMVNRRDVSFDWFDAAVLSHQLGQHLAKELKGYLPKKAA
jgi:hypothetical protein